MITPATTPLHPDDRLAAWTHKRSAYVNNEPAARQFCLRPVTRINLATPGGQPHRKRGNNLRGGGVEMQTRSRVPEIRPVTAAEAPSINGQHTRFWGSCGSMALRVVLQPVSRGSVRPASPNFPQRRKQKWLTALAVIGNTLGGLLLFCAAFYFVVMVGFLMEQMK